MKRSLLVFSLFFTAWKASSQIQFQKLYNQTDSASNLQGYDSKATPDGGYVFAGIASEGTSLVYHPFITKVNCKGIEEWSQAFGTTQSTANISSKIILTHDSGFAFISNIGVYTNYNGFAVRLDKHGAILWQKTLNLSTGNDVLTDIKETSNGHFIITGFSKNTPDVSLVKLDSNGNMMWHKTFGNNGQYDEGNAIIETSDSGYVLTGRYISMGTFNAFLLKTDSNGNKLWFKCFGDSLQNTNGIDVKESTAGDLILVGSTTLNKTNFQSFPDNFIIKCTSQGDTLWTRIFNGSPDEFENATSITFDDQGNYLLGVSTASYPTNGNVPNKMAIAKYNPQGNLIWMKLYNDGYSHYPRLSPAFDGGFIMSGFSTRYSQPVGFRTLLLKLNNNLQSGCYEQDVTSSTTSISKSFKITQPTPTLGTSGTFTTNTGSSQIELNDSTLCESYPLLNATFTQNSFCVGDTIQFQSDSTSAIQWHWDFGLNGDTTDISDSQNPTFIYSDTGTYVVQLIVSNGCEQDTNSVSINIKYCEPANLPPIVNQTADAPFFVPSAFSPNGDGLNDRLKPIINASKPGLELLSMEIYNRMGNRVFMSQDPSNGWDGTMNRIEQPSGSYYFLIRYKYQGKVQIAKDDVMLIR